MIVVADAGPLHYLILLDHPDLLHRFYGEVFVPDAVATELTRPSAPETVRDWMSRPPEWLRLVQVETDRVQQVTDELDLLADARHPLIRARGRVSRFAGLPALEPPRVDVSAAAEERLEERDLLVRRRALIDVTLNQTRHGHSL